jgi:hypothetical protein
VQHAVGVVATFECLDEPLLSRFDVDGGASQRIDSTLDLLVVVLGARAELGDEVVAAIWFVDALGEEVR